MSNIINATPDEAGRIILELYGTKIEVDDSLFNEEGVAIIKKFGTDYEIHRPVAKTTEDEVEAEKPKTKKKKN